MVQFDYTSDLHLDFREGTNSPFIQDYFANKKSKYLIIAGDIGHSINGNIEFLKYLKDVVGYDEVFVVLGNHDRYIFRNKYSEKFRTGKEKAIATRKLYTDIGIKVLDGDSYEVGGITIGGADGWYDGKHGSIDIDEKDGLERWRNTLNDFHFGATTNFYETFQEEISKIISLQNKVDIMVSHVRPTISDKHTNSKFKGSRANSYFGFDYEQQLLEDTKLKVWVFGHVHDVGKYTVGKVSLLTNPVGYPFESHSKKLMTLTV